MAPAVPRPLVMPMMSTALMLGEEIDPDFLADLVALGRAVRNSRTNRFGSQSALGPARTPAAVRASDACYRAGRRGRERCGWQDDGAYPDTPVEPPRTRPARPSSPGGHGTAPPESPLPGSPGRSGRKSASSRPCGRVVQLSSLLPLLHVAGGNRPARGRDYPQGFRCIVSFTQNTLRFNATSAHFAGRQCLPFAINAGWWP